MNNIMDFRASIFFFFFNKKSAQNIYYYIILEYRFDMINCATAENFPYKLNWLLSILNFLKVGFLARLLF